MSDIESPESLSACFTGPIVASTKSLVRSLNLARVKVISKCLGPDASAVINGKFILADVTPESSILAFSAASLSLCIAILSFVRSMPLSDLKPDTSQSIILLSKSSPPNLLFPAVAKTSCTPSPISITETSNVPPPKS